jgi:hypothetical protein
VYRREFITDFSRVEGIPVSFCSQTATAACFTCFSTASSSCHLASAASPAAACLPAATLMLLDLNASLPSCCFYLPAWLQGMYIANQVDEVAMGAGGRAQYTDFLQVQASVADLAPADLELHSAIAMPPLHGAPYFGWIGEDLLIRMRPCIVSH